jgi:chitodextrinase
MTGKYDHPNYEYSIIVTNNSAQTIESGWTFEFNMPTTTTFTRVGWQVTSSTEVQRTAEWVRYKWVVGTVGQWGSGKLEPGASTKIDGALKLCFAGGPKAVVLNGFVQKKADPIAPTAPTGLTSLGVTDTSADLSWTAATDNIAVVGYDIQAVKGLTVVNASVTGTMGTISGLEPSSTYDVSVRAKDAAGNVSAWSAAIKVTTDSPFVDIIPPTIPGAPAASNITHNSLTFSWNKSTDNVGVAGYNVYVDGLLDSTVTDLGVALTGLTAEKVYTLEVEAFDAAGNKAKTTAITATTLPVPVDTEAPSIPANVSGTGSLNSISVSWTASTDNSGVVAGYEVYVNGLLETTVTGTSVEVINLLTNTEYTIEVLAFDAAIVPNKSLKSIPIIVMTGDSDPLCNGVPGNPSLTKDNWNGDPSYNITMNMWWGNNGSSVKLYENNVLIETRTIAANSPQAQKEVFSFTGKPVGSYVYKCILSNNFGETTSSELTVNVTH